MLESSAQRCDRARQRSARRDGSLPFRSIRQALSRPGRARWSSPGSTSRRRAPTRLRHPAGLGGAGLLDDPERQVLHVAHFGQPAIDAGGLAPRGRRPGRAAAEPDARRPQGPAAPGGHLHPGVLRQPRLPVLHRRHRQRPLGRHAARRRCSRRRACWRTGIEVVFWGTDAGDVELTTRSATSRCTSTSPAACRSRTR